MTKITETKYNQLSLKDLIFVCFESQTYDEAFRPFMKYGTPISADQWSNILVAYPHLVDECKCRSLKEVHWRKILYEQPQLAGHCPEEKWTHNISSWENDYMKPKKQTANDMVLDLIFHPVHAKFCHWSKLSARNWHLLLLFHPEFVSHCDMAMIAKKMLYPDDLLCLQPQWGKYFDISKLFDPGKFLKKNPEYESVCKWENISRQTWLYIMGSNPALLKYCDIKKFPIVTEDKHDGEFHGALAILNFAWLQTSPQFGFHENKTVHKRICQIIRENPEYLEKWNAYATAFYGRYFPTLHELGYFLSEYPELYPLCKKEWLTSQDWGFLIAKHPDMIHEANLEILTSDAWLCILTSIPTFACYCNVWEDFSAKEWLRLLCVHPEFFPKCPAKNYKKWKFASEWEKLLKAGCPVKGLIPEKIKKEMKGKR